MKLLATVLLVVMLYSCQKESLDPPSDQRKAPSEINMSGSVYSDCINDTLTYSGVVSYTYTAQRVRNKENVTIHIEKESFNCTSRGRVYDATISQDNSFVVDLPIIRTKTFTPVILAVTLISQDGVYYLPAEFVISVSVDPFMRVTVHIDRFLCTCS